MLNKNRVIVILLIVNVILLAKIISPSLKSLQQKALLTKQDKQREEFFDQVNPQKGYQLNASFGDLGPKMISSGVIDLAKFKDAYSQGGQPLDQEQLEILTNGSNKKIKITRENSYFLLNFFWAVGLNNKTKILTEGEMVKNGDPANYASTGGWTLARGNAMNYYANGNLVKLSPQQEELVNKVASNIYRPCCGNSTAFPDCNHGMALLGVLELMAANGATEQKMYEAAKYINAYWFPSTYFDLAQYFKAKENKNFATIDGKIILGKNYSSAAGYMTIRKWLAEKGLIAPPPKQGGSCGV